MGATKIKPAAQGRHIRGTVELFVMRKPYKQQNVGWALAHAAIIVLYLDTMTNYSSLRSALASGIAFGVAGSPKQDRRAQSAVGCLTAFEGGYCFFTMRENVCS